jgi:hypothetical protein
MAVREKPRREERLPPRRERPPTRSSGGAVGNERLTASTATVLLVLLAVEGATIPFLHRLLPVHIFVGMLLIPPVALKLGSTGWRFLRYYLRSRPYLLKGPPAPLLRFVVAPGVVASTLVLFATGVALLVVGPGGGIVLGLHKASFVVWFITMGVHVLAHVLKLPALTVADFRRGGRLGGARARALLLLGSLAAGVVLAAATYPSAHAWLHWVQVRHFGDG